MGRLSDCKVAIIKDRPPVATTQLSTGTGQKDWSFVPLCFPEGGLHESLCLWQSRTQYACPIYWCHQDLLPNSIPNGCLHHNNHTANIHDKTYYHQRCEVRQRSISSKAASQLHHPLVGIIAFRAATFDNFCKNWWLPPHSPSDQGGSEREPNTH